MTRIMVTRCAASGFSGPCSPQSAGVCLAQHWLAWWMKAGRPVDAMQTRTEKTVCEINFDSSEWLELDKLARKAGYGNAQVCANETGQWRATVGEFKTFLEGQIGS